MTRRQQVVILAVAGAMSAMLVAPPFRLTDGAGGHVNSGYGLIFKPPTELALVNVPLLLAQWFVVLVVGAAAFLLIRALPNGTTEDAENGLSEGLSSEVHIVHWMSAKLRSSPSSSGKVLRELPERTEVYVLERREEWVKVVLTDRSLRGWLSAGSVIVRPPY